MAGLEPPYFMDQILHAFVANADFGPAYGLVNVGGRQQCTLLHQRLQDMLPTVVINGVSKRNFTLNLLGLYLDIHGLRNPDNSGLWRPNDEMTDYLGPVIETVLAQADSRNPLERFVTNGWYNNLLITVLLDVTMYRNTLSPVEQAFLTTPQLAIDLHNEARATVRSWNCHRRMSRTRPRQSVSITEM